MIVTITQREDAKDLSSEEEVESSSPNFLFTDEISETSRLAVYGKKNVPLPRSRAHYINNITQEVL